jgi:TatD DNase family protein
MSHIETRSRTWKAANGSGDPSASDGPWVDTHGHIQLGDIPADEVLATGMHNVAWLVAPGVDVESSRASIDLARRVPDRVKSSAGLHPHDAALWRLVADDIAELAERADAIGETGLDFYRNLAPRGDQIDSFREHIALARCFDKPLIVHCRDAFADIHAILADSDPGPWVVLHCWTGGPRWTKRFLELGVTFSFAGPVAFETGDTVRRGAALVPPERCLVETDTPYLSPPPHRGEHNLPERVAYVGAALAGVWGIDTSEVARTTSVNAARVFRHG